MHALLGSNGNITSSTARALLQQRRPVRVIGRNAATLAPLRELGAEVAIGDIRQAGFLAQAFDGADAVYTMIPTDHAAPDLRRSQASFSAAIAAAIARSGVGRVVNLSSVGAEQASGTGPIVGLHEHEQRLDAIAGLRLLHLRPGYFMENHLLAARGVAATGAYVSLERADVPVPTIATKDIAAVVVRELDADTRGVLHLHGPSHCTFAQAAAILGRAIGRPDLPYVQTDPARGKSAMLEAGLSADVAERMAEMARWLSSGSHSAALPGPVEVTPTTLEDFAPRFRAAFESASRTAAEA